MNEQNSIENWKAAKKLFEKYIDLPLNESINEIQINQEIDSDVKTILLKLLNSVPDQETSLNTADLSFINVMKENEDYTGKTIDHFKLLFKIGHGGMSQVYKAQRIDAEIQKFIAIKILSTKSFELSKTHEYLFEQEQIALSKLSHPNIISFHHGGVSDDGLLYLVMDFEDSTPIDTYVINNNLSTTEIITLVKQVAKALSYSHSQLIVHRDIKPSNILIDQRGCAKVVDFGIASFVRKEGDKHQSLKMYTPDYASPEQLSGQNISITTDIFSLTAVLFQLLTNKKPLPQTKYNETELQQHLNTHLKDFDQDIQNMILKGMNFNSVERYSNMDEFEQDLDHWLNFKPLTATPKTIYYRISKFVNRRTALSVTLMFTSFAIVLGVTMTIKQKNKAELEAQKANQVTQFLIDSLQKNDPDITKGKEISVRELLLNAKTNIKEAQLENKQLVTSLEHTIGSALAKIGQYKDAEQLLSRAIETDKDNIDARIQLADVYIEQKQLKNVSKIIEYITIFAPKLTQKQTLKLTQIQAKLFAEQGEFDAAIGFILNLNEKLDSMDIKSKLQNNLILAQIYNDSGRQNQQIKLLEKSLKISQKSFGKLSTTSTDIAFNLAEAYTNIDPSPWNRIETLYTETIDNQQTIYGKNHPIVGKSLLKYGFLLKSNGDIDKSRSIAQQAKEIALINFDNQHIFTAHVNILLSQLNGLTGIWTKAIEQLESAVKVYESHYGINHFETNQTKTTLVAYYLKQNQNAKALALLRPLYVSQKQQLGEDNRATLYVHLNLIKALNQLEKYDEAINEGEKALKLSQQHLGKEFPITIGIQQGLSESYYHSKQLEKAIELAKPLLEIPLVENNPAYNKKISLHLIHCYLESKLINQADLLRTKIINQYYVDESSYDDFYNELISN